MGRENLCQERTAGTEKARIASDRSGLQRGRGYGSAPPRRIKSAMLSITWPSTLASRA